MKAALVLISEASDGCREEHWDALWIPTPKMLAEDQRLEEGKDVPLRALAENLLDDGSSGRPFPALHFKLTNTICDVVEAVPSIGFGGARDGDLLIWG